MDAKYRNALTTCHIRVPTGITARQWRDVLGSVARDRGTLISDMIRDILLSQTDIAAKVKAKESK